MIAFRRAPMVHIWDEDLEGESFGKTRSRKA